MRALVAQSADRPFTDSEVRFLKYIRQWGKKVVFLVNKVDILRDSSEVSGIGSGVEKRISLLSCAAARNGCMLSRHQKACDGTKPFPSDRQPVLLTVWGVLQTA